MAKSTHTKECPSCAMEIGSKLDVCPICGYEFAETKKSKRIQLIIVLLLIILFICYFVFRI